MTSISRIPTGLATRAVLRPHRFFAEVATTPAIGGALVPVIQGYFADHVGILNSFFVPVVCYLYIVFYGLYGYRPARA